MKTTSNTIYNPPLSNTVDLSKTVEIGLQKNTFTKEEDLGVEILDILFVFSKNTSHKFPNLFYHAHFEKSGLEPSIILIMAIEVTVIE